MAQFERQNDECCAPRGGCIVAAQEARSILRSDSDLIERLTSVTAAGVLLFPAENFSETYFTMVIKLPYILLNCESFHSL